MKNQAAVVGSSESGHPHYPGRTTGKGSSNVFVNGKGFHRKGDSWGVHCKTSKPYDCHSSVTTSGSSTVYVNGRSAARKGDSSGCGGVITSGSHNVYVG